jgi:hypothetical protein
MYRTLLSTALPFALVACAVPYQAGPSDEEIANADYGPAPTAYQALLERDVRARFRSIVHVRFGTPRRAWYGELGGLTETRDIRFGWAVNFRAYTIGFTALNKLAVQGDYFFRDDQLQGIAVGGEFKFLPVPG